jgi:general secretion pathway protein H
MRTIRHPAGFSLIEMIVVMAVMAMIAGLVLVRQPWRSATLNTDVTLRALTDGLRLARSRAIAQDRNVRVITAPGGFSVDEGAPWRLPAGQVLNASQVIFTPDGGSTGATFLLASGSRRITVTVNWLTGRVALREMIAQ